MHIILLQENNTLIFKGKLKVYFTSLATSSSKRSNLHCDSNLDTWAKAFKKKWGVVTVISKNHSKIPYNVQCLYLNSLVSTDYFMIKVINDVKYYDMLQNWLACLFSYGLPKYTVGSWLPIMYPLSGPGKRRCAYKHELLNKNPPIKFFFK